MSRRRIFKRSIRVELTPEEKAVINETIIAKSKSLTQVQEKMASIKKGLGAIIKEHKWEINKLLKRSNDGWKTVSVDCVWRFDYFNRTKTAIQLDTGTVVATEPIANEDLQQDIEDAIPPTNGETGSKGPMDVGPAGDPTQEDENLEDPWPGEEEQGEGAAGEGDTSGG